MEQEIVKVADAVPDPDPVTETLERLEVADTIEDLRHHIDELIARLSEQENAGAPAAERARVSPDLEGQLENLGGKVESASCLLAELADLLEAQTERIETIEQQLGDPDLVQTAPPEQQDVGSSTADIPRFSMRPPQGELEVGASAVAGAAEALDSMRRYLEMRFDRLETAIRQVEDRVSDMRAGAEQRERQVRELEERLLILVESSPGQSTTSVPSSSGEPRADGGAPVPAGFSRRGERRREQAAVEHFESVKSLPPRPPHMPVFAHEAARARRRLVRRAGGIAPPSVCGLVPEAPGTGSTADQDRSSEARGSSSGDSLVPHYVAAGRSRAAEGERSPLTRQPAAAVHAARDQGNGSPANGSIHDVEVVARASAGAVAPAQPQARAMRHARGFQEIEPGPREDTGARGREVPSAVRELERLVERDVKARREFQPGAADGLRPSKAHPTVLVVDDAPDALTVLSIYLSKTGYNVVTATSAEDCLAKLRHHAIDAIVLDARLPGASGEHVCRVLREDPAFKHRRDVPVIIYTGYPDEFPAAVRDLWQADEYVTKGGDMLPLMRALVRHTSRDNRAS